MSAENTIPKIFVKVSSGSGHCPNGECAINVENQFQTTSKYLILDGTVNIKYDGEEKTALSSPYTNTGWSEYVDSWEYDKSVTVTTGDTSAVFAQVTLKSQDESNNIAYYATSAYVYNLSNEMIVKTVNADSWIYVKGETFTLDGVEKNIQGLIAIKQERDVIISSTGSCKVLYIEKA
jgi:hypothetical protein